MKKKLLAILLTVCLVISIAPAALAASGTISGTGTEADPYLIEDLADLEAFRNAVNGGDNYAGKYVKLAASIDLSSVDNWTPIGTESNKFSGIFDGNGNTISGLKITTDVEGAGLFGYTNGTANASFDEVSDIWSNNTLSETAISESDYTTVIKNLKLANVTVVGKERVGALIGRAANTYIFDCDVISGSVSGVAKMGGVIGQIDNCVVKNCDNAASVIGSGEYNYGGVIGTARGGSANAVIGCNNTGALSFSLTNGGAGGVLGQYSESALVVYNCTNSGNIILNLDESLSNNTDKGKAVAE